MRYWIGIFKEAFRRFGDDDHVVYAGHMAFTLLLSFGPFVVCAILLSKQFDPFADLHLIEMLRQLEENALLPKAMADLFVGVIEQVSPGIGEVANLGENWPLLLVPALVGLYAGSSAFEAARNGFNEAYDVRDRRFFLFRRAQSHLLALALAILFVLASTGFVTVTVGFNFIDELQAVMARWGADEKIWSVIVLLVLAFFVLLLFWALLMGIHLTLPRGYVKRWHLYVWADDETPDDPRAVRVPIRPGVRITAVAWVLFAVIYSSLLGTIIKFDSNHGALAGVVATLLFFYISAATIFFGAQINIAMATIDKDGKPKWPHPSLARPSDLDETKLEAYRVLTREKPSGVFSRLWHYLCGGAVCDPAVDDEFQEAIANRQALAATASETAARESGDAPQHGAG